MSKENHYVYLLSSKIEERHYIGVRSCLGNIGDDSYIGSSSCMTDFDKSNCNKIIIKRFNTRKEAVEHEVLLHKEFDVSNNKLFWNKAKQTNTGFDTTGRKMSIEEREKRGVIQKRRFATGAHPTRGRKLSKEHRKKIGMAGKGKVHTEYTKKLMAKKASGIKNSAFKPWYVEIDGIRTVYTGITPKEFAIANNLSVQGVKDRFRTKYKNYVGKIGPLRGMCFGRI